VENETAIEVKSVGKTFKLPHERYNSVKSILINFYKRNKSFELQKALSGVSFDVKKGEFFGIVGRNGSGKSTLLKLLAGIYSPDSGSISIKGKLTPFIELGVGFSPELTGRENVYLNGALFGFNRKEITAMYNDIVEFAELERFMDQKLKNYSSGMQVRLAFSIAIRAQSDVLILDEVLAVGDMDFQQKCFDYFATLKKSSRTVILVTHDMGSVLKFCDRAMLVNKGKVVQIGSPKEIADAYIEMNYEKKEAPSETGVETTRKHDHAYIKSADITQNGKAKTKFVSGEVCDIKINFESPNQDPLHLGVQVFSNEGVYCYGTNTKIADQEPIQNPNGSATVSLKLDLVPGRYTITTATLSDDGISVYDYRPNTASFLIKKTTELEGVANLEQSWKI
jgi:ABC-2 type transport system ATP-binding protein